VALGGLGREVAWARRTLDRKLCVQRSDSPQPKRRNFLTWIGTGFGGASQQIHLDVRGQNVSRSDLNNMIDRMVKRSNGVIQPENIKIIR
jgi:hypothetical protein